MNSIAVEAVRAYGLEVEDGRFAPDHKVVVGGNKVLHPVRLDNDLYEWLRTTASHQRTSMTTLMVAALVHARRSDAGS